MFIWNFQDTYERPSIAETLKTIKKKHGKSLWNYVKCFCNARNAIPYIQDIEIINIFHDGVIDVKSVEEITMKKLRMVVDQPVDDKKKGAKNKVILADPSNPDKKLRINTCLDLK
jgi:DNA-binding ferritin-like protein (Dps family)